MQIDNSKKEQGHQLLQIGNKNMSSATAIRL